LTTVQYRNHTVRFIEWCIMRKRQVEQDGGTDAWVRLACTARPICTPTPTHPPSHPYASPEPSAPSKHSAQPEPFVCPSDPCCF
jgi:hypothetical protein